MVHFDDTGSQAHSVGLLYPWSVLYKGRHGSFRCCAFNCLTGEELTEHRFYYFANKELHEEAHKAVIRDIDRRENGHPSDRDYQTAMQDLAKLGYPSAIGD